MPTADREHFLTLIEAAQEMRISRRTLASLVAAGRLAVHRPSPRRVVVSRKDLDTYMRTQRQSAVRP